MDIAKTYLGEINTHYLIQADFAFKADDKDKFVEAVKWVEVTLEGIENILSTRPDYSLEVALKEVMSIPGTNTYVDKLMKQGMVNWDYCANDVYEQLHYFYRPKVELFLNSRGVKFGLPEPEYPDISLQDRWLIPETNSVPDKYKYKGTTFQAILDAYRAVAECPLIKAIK